MCYAGVMITTNGYATRWQILERDDFTCQYCGQSAPNVVLHVEHRAELCTGGEYTLDNLVTACSACNQGKELARRGAAHVPHDRLGRGWTPGKPGQQTLVWDALAEPARIKPIADHTDIPMPTVRMVLFRLAQKGYVRNLHGVWSRIDEPGVTVT